MRKGRIILALALGAVLLPLTWLRALPPPAAFSPVARIVPLATQDATIGPLTLVAGWEVVSGNRDFGGFSALIALDNKRLLAGSDAAWTLALPRPDRGGRRALLGRIDSDQDGPKYQRDLESLTRNPDSGQIWGGFENSNAIMRFTPQFARDGEVRVPAMAEWRANGGPESLTRFADGRFLAIEESPRRWFGSRHEALLFASDPVADGAFTRLLLEAPQGYRPVDLAALDERRALVLYRNLAIALPPRFDSAIGLVKIVGEGDETELESSMLARFDARIPAENYEGMAITREAGTTHVWLISDDNFRALQRTLLLKLRLDTAQLNAKRRAEEPPRAP